MKTVQILIAATIVILIALMSGCDRVYAAIKIPIATPTATLVPTATPTPTPIATPDASVCAEIEYNRKDWGDHPPVPVGAVAKWWDADDGHINVTKLEHDHHVSIKDAHLSGGCLWDIEKKKAFTKDVNNLVPTTTSFNRSKSNKTPNELVRIAKRLVDTPEERCDYATITNNVKAKWGLSMTPAERSTVDAWLDEC